MCLHPSVQIYISAFLHPPHPFTQAGDALLAPFGDSVWWPERETIIAYASIPIVSCGFTYFHIWLALWMMFYPLNFIGVCQVRPHTRTMRVLRLDPKYVTLKVY